MKELRKSQPSIISFPSISFYGKGKDRWLNFPKELQHHYEKWFFYLWPLLFYLFRLIFYLLEKEANGKIKRKERARDKPFFHYTK